MKKYYSTHPEDFKHYTTEEIREKYLMDNLFKSGEITLNYSFDDRIIAGSVVPLQEKLIIEKVLELKSDFFLQRREMGIINIGGDGKIVIDGEEYDMNTYDGFYVGKGIKRLEFISIDANNPAKYYINSSPAHIEYPSVHIPQGKANRVEMGEDKLCNERTIYQYVHPLVCASAQLCMGMTVLKEGSVWNTMPPHTHDRRMEVYLYFNMPSDRRVFHLMGEKDQTRHMILKNEDAIISPSWSIHSGVGVGNYTFIWGMCGENQTFDDMDHIAVEELR